MRKLVLLLPLLLGLGFGQNLLLNGDFEQPLSTGWTETHEGYGIITFDRQTYYDPDPDYEAMDSIYSGAGSTRLTQIVEVPGPLLQLNFTAKFALGGGTSSTCWPVASFAVSYYDALDNKLGETRFYLHDSNCTWIATPTLSLIEVSSLDWQNYQLNIADELNTNLPGVDPALVMRVGVALFDTTAGG
jgi:hypothetical protein